MKAVLTFDNGQKLIVDIIKSPIMSENKRKKMRFHSEYEREFVDSWNKAQPHAVHKIVKAHILRN